MIWVSRFGSQWFRFHDWVRLDFTVIEYDWVSRFGFGWRRKRVSRFGLGKGFQGELWSYTSTMEEEEWKKVPFWELYDGGVKILCNLDWLF